MSVNEKLLAILNIDDDAFLHRLEASSLAFIHVSHIFLYAARRHGTLISVGLCNKEVCPLSELLAGSILRVSLLILELSKNKQNFIRAEFT